MSKYTRKNPNGKGFRIPIEAAKNFHIVQNGTSVAIFGDIVDKLGEYEELVDLKELKAFMKTKK